MHARKRFLHFRSQDPVTLTFDFLTSKFVPTPINFTFLPLSDFE